jgi:hypothetical protein
VSTKPIEREQSNKKKGWILNAFHLIYSWFDDHICKSHERGECLAAEIEREKYAKPSVEQKKE